MNQWFTLQDVDTLQLLIKKGYEVKSCTQYDNIPFLLTFSKVSLDVFIQ